MAKKVLVVVDMQNDFITGSLGTPEAQAIVPKVVEKIQGFGGTVLYTQDTHGADYLQTQEGRNLPVEHCLKGTWGWQLEPPGGGGARQQPHREAHLWQQGPGGSAESPAHL